MFWKILITCLAIPLVMILFGFLWRNSAPKKINMFYGFRTALSMKNRDTWEFAHKHISKVWLIVGTILLIFTGIAVAMFHYKDVEIVLPVILNIQVLILILSTVPSLIALRKTFNKDGTRKINNSKNS